MRRLLDRIPPPLTRFEELISYGVLFEAALRARRSVAGTSIRQRAEHALRLLLSGPFEHRQHEPSRAERVARAILETREHRFNLTRIAVEMRCDVTTLRREFKATFGMSMREFQTRVHVCRAIRLFAAGTHDVTAVARTLGYGSDKNFYRAVRRVTDLTPAELRDSQLGRDLERCEWMLMKGETNPACRLSAGSASCPAQLVGVSPVANRTRSAPQRKRRVSTRCGSCPS